MSESPSPSSTGSSSRAEVLSLRRVSHRLVMTPDSDLSRILQALLPRALLKMSQNETLLENDRDSSKENIQIVLKEIVTHALERIRGVDADMPVTWVGEVASFISSVCSFDDQHKPSHQNTVICDFKSYVLDSQMLSAPMQFQGECYHVIGAYMRRRNSLVPALDDPTFFEIPGNLLICLMAEDDDTLKEIIAASLHSVLHVYEAHLESDLACQTNYKYSLRVADLFPITLSASCSYNSLIRLSTVKSGDGVSSRNLPIERDTPRSSCSSKLRCQ